MNKPLDWIQETSRNSIKVQKANLKVLLTDTLPDPFKTLTENVTTRANFAFLQQQKKLHPSFKERKNV